MVTIRQLHTGHSLIIRIFQHQRYIFVGAEYQMLGVIATLFRRRLLCFLLSQSVECATAQYFFLIQTRYQFVNDGLECCVKPEFAPGKRTSKMVSDVSRDGRRWHSNTHFIFGLTLLITVPQFSTGQCVPVRMCWIRQLRQTANLRKRHEINFSQITTTEGGRMGFLLTWMQAFVNCRCIDEIAVANAACYMRIDCLQIDLWRWSRQIHFFRFRVYRSHSSNIPVYPNGQRNSIRLSSRLGVPNDHSIYFLFAGRRLSCVDGQRKSSSWKSAVRFFF